jgi:hypothetical protein
MRVAWTTLLGVASGLDITVFFTGKSTDGIATSTDKFDTVESLVGDICLKFVPEVDPDNCVVNNEARGSEDGARL